jgi:hypothetical protein
MFAEAGRLTKEGLLFMFGVDSIRGYEHHFDN